MGVQVCAITLDLDNTLWDVFPALEKAEANSHRYMSEHYPRIVERFSVEDIPQLRESVFETHPHINHDVTEIRKQVFVHMLSECEYDPADAEDLMRRFQVDRNKVEFYPDALPALKRLADVYPIVSLSDGNADLSVIGIRHYFIDCVSATLVGYAKPHPAGFLKACEIAGVEPREVLHIGDNPVADIVGARQVGLQTMWVCRDGEQWTEDFQPDYRVSSLTEAVEILC